MHAVHIPMAIPPESMQIIVIQAAAYKETTAKELIRKSAGPMLATVLLAMASPMAAAQWMAGSTVEAVHNDNVTHSPLPKDVLSDNSAEVALWRSLHVQLADYTSLQLQGTLTRHQFQHFAGLSSTSLSGSAEFSHKFGVGAEIPVLSFTTLIERSLFNDSNRNRSLYSGGLALRQRIQDEWQWSVTAVYERQDGDYGPAAAVYTPAGPKPGKVWDLASWQLALKAEWDLSASSWLAATVSYRDGDIVATTHPYLEVLEVSSDVAVDATFGNGMIAYRLKATSYSFALDWNHALGASSTLYLGAERQWSRGANDLAYQTGIIRGGFLHNF